MLRGPIDRFLCHALQREPYLNVPDGGALLERSTAQSPLRDALK